MLELGLKSLLSYLLGSIIGALIVGQLRGGVDIRTVGSGNAGGTNALRTQGKAFAFWVMLIDIGKGVFATAVLPWMDIPGVATDPQVSREWLVVACAVAVMLGHVFPLWYGFRGGKGAATFLGTLLGMQPVLLVPVLMIWIVVLLLSGYVGLATIVSAASLPVYVSIADGSSSHSLLAFGVFAVLFIAFTHRSNIARMMRGDEHRAQRLWLFSRWRH